MAGLVAALAVIQQLFALGIQFGPELIQDVELVFAAAVALASGKPLSEDQKAQIDKAFENINAALDAAEKKKEEEAAAAGQA